MLYFRALFHGIAELPVGESRNCARAIDARAREAGLACSCTPNWRARIPCAAARIHPNDAQRIQRALEVLALSGRTLDEHWQRQPATVGNLRLELLLAANR